MNCVRPHLWLRPSSVLPYLLLKLLLFRIYLNSLNRAILDNLIYRVLLRKILLVSCKQVSSIKVIFHHINTVNSVMISPKTVVIRAKNDILLSMSLRSSSTTLWASISIFRLRLLRFLSLIAIHINMLNLSKPIMIRQKIYRI